MKQEKRERLIANLKGLGVGLLLWGFFLTYGVGKLFDEPVLIGLGAWYGLVVLAACLIIYVTKRIMRKARKRKHSPTDESPYFKIDP
jgi:hypothetical protein